MGQEFRITITAADKASEVIDQINAKMDRITEPIERTRKAAGLLGKEKGISTTANSIVKMGEAALTAEKRIGGVVEAATNVIQMPGVAGGVAAAGGVVASLTDRWSKFGFEIDRTSKLLGISERDLQRYRLAGEMLGVDQEKTTNALHAFGVAAQDARWGRNPAALMALNQLNVPVQYTPTGAVDTTKMLQSVIKALGDKNVPVQTKEMAADLLGLSDLLPIVIEGADRLNDKLRKVDESHAVMSRRGIEAAKELHESIKQIGTEYQGIVNIIREGFLPWMNRAVNAMKPSNRTYVPGRGLSGYVEDQAGFIRWLFGGKGKGQQTDKQESPIEKWERAATGRTHLGIRNNNPGNLRRWGDAPVVNGFARFDTPEAGIAAMTGNLQSYGRKGYNTIGKIINRWAPESDNNNTGAYVAHVSRMTGFAPNQPLDMNDQATMEKLVAAIIQHENGKNPYDKEMISGAVSSRLGGRRDYVTANPPMVQQGAGDAASAPAGGSPGKITVDVNFQNAPPGTQVRNYVEGPVSANTRIGYSNPGTL